MELWGFVCVILSFPVWLERLYSTVFLRDSSDSPVCFEGFGFWQSFVRRLWSLARNCRLFSSFSSVSDGTGDGLGSCMAYGQPRMFTTLCGFYINFNEGNEVYLLISLIIQKSFYWRPPLMGLQLFIDMSLVENPLMQIFVRMMSPNSALSQAFGRLNSLLVFFLFSVWIKISVENRNIFEIHHSIRSGRKCEKMNLDLKSFHQ